MQTMQIRLYFILSILARCGIIALLIKIPNLWLASFIWSYPSSLSARLIWYVLLNYTLAYASCHYWNINHASQKVCLTYNSILTTKLRMLSQSLDQDSKLSVWGFFCVFCAGSSETRMRSTAEINSTSSKYSTQTCKHNKIILIREKDKHCLNHCNLVDEPIFWTLLGV